MSNQSDDKILLLGCYCMSREAVFHCVGENPSLDQIHYNLDLAADLGWFVPVQQVPVSGIDVQWLSIEYLIDFCFQLGLQVIN